ncbi:MAG: sigma-70 family RNA polymerase sigma factor [Ruminococcaceae bacterium]|nr:sigma-70 family RNA polymerase sigma factor [Oscillospiraceae bacterium]
MDKKEFLRSYTLQQAKIKRLKDMQTLFPEKAKQYQTEIKRCLEARKRIEKSINSVKNELYKEVLIQKYICKKTHEEIGLILNYSTRHIDRLHLRALEMFQIKP